MVTSQSLEPLNATVYGKRDSKDVIKAFEIHKVSWITWVGPKCNHRVLRRGTQEEPVTKGDVIDWKQRLE